MELRIDAMIGGVEKGGTTTLACYIGRHPNVLSPFDDADQGAQEFSVFANADAADPDRMEGAYLSAFGRAAEAEETVVAKSVDIMHQREAAHALYRHNPDCRLIISLRNPVERAYSSFWYQRYRGAEDAQTFERALELEEKRAAAGDHDPHRMYVGKGEYIDHLLRLSNLFGRSRLHVLLLEDLAQDPEAAVNEIFEFLDLDRYPIETEDDLIKNSARITRWPVLIQFLYRESFFKSAFRHVVPRRIREELLLRIRRISSPESPIPALKPKTRRALVDHFAPYNERLERFLGRRLDHWNC